MGVGRLHRRRLRETRHTSAREPSGRPHQAVPPHGPRRFLVRRSRRLPQRGAGGFEYGLEEQDPQIPQSIWYHTDADFVGFRVVRPLTPPSVEDAKRFDIDPVQLQDMLDYMEIKGESY